MQKKKNFKLLNYFSVFVYLYLKTFKYNLFVNTNIEFPGVIF